MASPGEINGLQEVCQILLRSRNPLPSNTLSATTPAGRGNMLTGSSKCDNTKALV